MANGVLIESRIQATNIDALNKSAVSSTIDVAGGGLVALAPPTTQGEDRWVATAPDTVLTGLYMAYNPSEHLTLVNGKHFAGLTADPRDYVNLKGRTFTAFQPKVGDEIVITADCVDASVSTAVAEDILEAKAGQTTLTRIAAATGATADTTAFKIEWVGVLPFPQNGIGMEQVKVFKCVCVQE